MSIQHLNDVKAIARTARQIGATLPADITDALDHLETITMSRSAPPQAGLIARGLADHLGDPAKMEKARKAAALDLAAADARAKIDVHLIETCGSRIRALMQARRDEVVALIGEALGGQLATLAATAPQLPEWFKPNQADRLDPVAFEAWTQARDAYACIGAVQDVLGFLYAGAINQQHAESFPIAATRSLRFAKVPALDTVSDAHAFRDALQGRVSPAREGAAQGPVSVDGIFVPTLLAHLGATFEWATPAEVTERAASIYNAMVERVSR